MIIWMLPDQTMYTQLCFVYRDGLIMGDGLDTFLQNTDACTNYFPSCLLELL